MLQCVITKTKDLEPVTYDWGGVKWVANSELAPGSTELWPVDISRQTNPEWNSRRGNPLCSEWDVRVGDRRMKVVPGQTLVIPQGVEHEVANSGWEPVVYVCSFSASTRGTLFEDPSVPGARPLSGKHPQPW